MGLAGNVNPAKTSLIITRLAKALYIYPHRHNSIMTDPAYLKLRRQAVKMAASTNMEKRCRDMITALECIALKKRFPKSLSKISILSARSYNRWLRAHH